MTSFLLDQKFWVAACERAAKTAAQAAAAFFVVGSAALDSVDWAQVGGAAVVGAVASLLTSIASAPFGDEGTPSLVSESGE